MTDRLDLIKMSNSRILKCLSSFSLKEFC